MLQVSQPDGKQGEDTLGSILLHLVLPVTFCNAIMYRNVHYPFKSGMIKGNNPISDEKYKNYSPPEHYRLAGRTFSMH